MKSPNRKSAPQGHKKSRESKGFSMVETMIAIVILAVGVMSLATLMPYATQNDYRSRMDTTATFIAARQLEQMLAQPYIVTNFTSAADGAGNTANIIVSCGAPGCAAGATVVGGLISFAGAAPNGYGRIYTIPASGVAGSPKVNGGTYDVRWNVSQNASGVRTILIAARPQGNQPGTTSLPANLRAVKMK